MVKEQKRHLEGFIGGTLVRLLLMQGDEEAVLVNVSAVLAWEVPEVLKLPKMTRRIVAMAARGATNLEIARDLHRSPETIKTHLARAYEALGIGSRAELATLVRGAMLHPE